MWLCVFRLVWPSIRAFDWVSLWSCCNFRWKCPLVESIKSNEQKSVLHISFSLTLCLPLSCIIYHDTTENTKSKRTPELIRSVATMTTTTRHRHRANLLYIFELSIGFDDAVSVYVMWPKSVWHQKCVSYIGYACENDSLSRIYYIMVRPSWHSWLMNHVCARRASRHCF